MGDGCCKYLVVYSGSVFVSDKFAGRFNWARSGLLSPSDVRHLHPQRRAII